MLNSIAVDGERIVVPKRFGVSVSCSSTTRSHFILSKKCVTVYRVSAFTENCRPEAVFSGRGAGRRKKQPGLGLRGSAARRRETTGSHILEMISMRSRTLLA